MTYCAIETLNTRILWGQMNKPTGISKVHNKLCAIMFLIHENYFSLMNRYVKAEIGFPVARENVCEDGFKKTSIEALCGLVANIL